jgi:hypothetical protein
VKIGASALALDWHVERLHPFEFLVLTCDPFDADDRATARAKLQAIRAPVYRALGGEPVEIGDPAKFLGLPPED